VSGLYIYALAAEPPTGLPGTGLAGEALQSIACGPLYALVGSLADRPALDPTALAGHDAAVRRLAAALPALLPVRFGEWAPDGPTLVERLAPRAAELADALTLVRGCVQMTLRVFGSSEAPAPAPDEAPAEVPADCSDPSSGPGTCYLAARRRALQQAHEVPEIADLRSALQPLLRAERARRHAGGPLLATVCHLIERPRLPAYQELLAVESLRTAVRIAASGPWPPYAFAPEGAV
jgi:hypothetical protein